MPESLFITKYALIEGRIKWERERETDRQADRETDRREEEITHVVLFRVEGVIGMVEGNLLLKDHSLF